MTTAPDEAGHDDARSSSTPCDQGREVDPMQRVVLALRGRDVEAVAAILAMGLADWRRRASRDGLPPPPSEFVGFVEEVTDRAHIVPRQPSRSGFQRVADRGFQSSPLSREVGITAVARQLGVSRQAVGKAIRQGRLKAHRGGPRRAWRVNVGDVEVWGAGRRSAREVGPPVGEQREAM